MKLEKVAPFWPRVKEKNSQALFHCADWLKTKKVSCRHNYRPLISWRACLFLSFLNLCETLDFVDFSIFASQFNL